MKISFLLALSVFALVIPAKAQYDNMENWYLKTQDSLDLFVSEFGNGAENLVVVHGGFGANHYYMLEAIESLQDRFKIVLYDQRGSLLSPAPDSKLDFSRNVQDLDRLIDELGDQKVHLLCHSMGTLVGMEYAKQHSNRILSMVLVGALPAKADGLDAIFDERYSKQVAELKTRPSVKALEETYIRRMSTEADEEGYYYFNSGLSDKELTELWRIRFAAVNIYRMENWKDLEGGRAFFNARASMMAQSVDWEYDYRFVLSQIPTTIIMGDHDFIDFDGSRHRELIKGFPEIELIIIDAAGHNPWIDNPEKFASVLDRNYSN